MTEEQINNVLRILTEGLVLTNGRLQVEEPGHVSVIQGSLPRELAAEGGESVTVEIIDHGADFHQPQYRYFCTVRTSAGREAVGNGGATPEEALETMHWCST